MIQISGCLYNNNILGPLCGRAHYRANSVREIKNALHVLRSGTIFLECSVYAVGQPTTWPFADVVTQISSHAPFNRTLCGVDGGDRRHTVVQANGQERKGRSEGGVLYIVSKHGNTAHVKQVAQPEQKI